MGKSARGKRVTNSIDLLDAKQQVVLEDLFRTRENVRVLCFEDPQQRMLIELSHCEDWILKWFRGRKRKGDVFRVRESESSLLTSRMSMDGEVGAIAICTDDATWQALICDLLDPDQPLVVQSLREMHGIYSDWARRISSYKIGIFNTLPFAIDWWFLIEDQVYSAAPSNPSISSDPDRWNLDTLYGAPLNEKDAWYLMQKSEERLQSTSLDKIIHGRVNIHSQYIECLHDVSNHKQNQLVRLESFQNEIRRQLGMSIHANFSFQSKLHQKTFIRIRNCKVGYQCALTYELLKASAGSVFDKLASKRNLHCRTCNKTVHHCETDEEIAAAIRLDYCISVEVTEKSYRSDIDRFVFVGFLRLGPEWKHP